MAVASNRNYHQHVYPNLDPKLSITGYVIAVHEVGGKTQSMIGPIPTYKAAEQVISYLYDMEDLEFHLWPLAAPKELLNGE